MSLSAIYSYRTTGIMPKMDLRTDRYLASQNAEGIGSCAFSIPNRIKQANDVLFSYVTPPRQGSSLRCANGIACFRSAVRLPADISEEMGLRIVWQKMGQVQATF